MFTRIAPRYDFLNHLLSLSFDRPWRARTARRFAHILARPDARVLDLCCGTGDLTFALERAAIRAAKGQETARIFGSDFVPPMLALARKKARRARHAATFLAADALSLPFPDQSFDLVTAAFGFRNLSNYDRGLREIFRILRPGGELGILEFSEPRGKGYRPPLPLLLRKNSSPHRQHYLRQLHCLLLSPRLRSQISRPRGTIRLDDPRRLHRGRFHSLDVQRCGAPRRSETRECFKQGSAVRLQDQLG